MLRRLMPPKSARYACIYYRQYLFINIYFIINSIQITTLRCTMRSYRRSASFFFLISPRFLIFIFYSLAKYDRIANDIFPARGATYTTWCLLGRTERNKDFFRHLRFRGYCSGVIIYRPSNEDNCDDNQDTVMYVDKSRMEYKRGGWRE